MPSAVKILFMADGYQTVSAIFKSLKKEAQELQQMQARTARTTATATAKAANDSTKAAHAAASQRLKIEADTVRAQNQIVVAGAKRTNSAYLAELRNRLAMDRDAAKQSAQIERERTRTAERESSRRAQTARQQARAVSASGRGWANGTSAAISRAARGTIGTITGVAGSFGLAGGGMMIGNGVMKSLNLQRQAVLLSNATSMPGAPGMDPHDIVKMARGVAGTTGLEANDVMAGMNKVSARAGGARGLNALKGDIDDIAKTAVSAGVSMEDMGGVYAAALNAGVAPGKEMQQLMRDFVAQGKIGAVEFADLAGELAKIGGAGKAFGGGANMLRAASGLAQLAVETAVSPEEARTSVVDLMREFSQGPKLQALKTAGVKTEGVGGKLRDPMEMLPEIIEAAEKKGLGKHGYKGRAGLSEIFTGKSMETIATPLRELYLNGYESERTGKKYTGKDAVRQKIEDARVAGMSEEQRNAEFQKVMATDMQKVAVAMEKFGGEMDKLLPTVSELLPAALEAVKGLGEMAKFAAENPFKALGGIFAAHLSTELANAAIGATIKKAILAMLASNPGTGVGVGGVPGAGAGGRLGQVAAVAGAGVVGFGVGTALSDWIHTENGENVGKSFAQKQDQAWINSEHSLRMVREGKENVTPEIAKQRAQWMRDLANKTREVQDPSVWRSIYTLGGANIEAKASAGAASPKELEAQAAQWDQVAISTGNKIGDAVVAKINSASLANPNNPGRSAPASSMASGK